METCTGSFVLSYFRSTLLTFEGGRGEKVIDNRSKKVSAKRFVLHREEYGWKPQRTQMGNNVAVGSLDLLGKLGLAANLAEKQLRREVEQVREQIETATVRHAQHNLGHPSVGARPEQRVQSNHHGLRALKAVPLQLREPLPHEVVKRLN
jgi:hypothetical protein